MRICKCIFILFDLNKILRNRPSHKSIRFDYLKEKRRHELKEIFFLTKIDFWNSNKEFTSKKDFI